jgi:hypothetical protein
LVLDYPMGPHLYDLPDVEKPEGKRGLLCVCMFFPAEYGNEFDQCSHVCLFPLREFPVLQHADLPCTHLTTIAGDVLGLNQRLFP